MSHTSLVLLLAAVAQPGGEASVFELPALCQPGVWRLPGAGVAGGGDATFSESWLPSLRQVAACASRPSLRGACLLVQGHYDNQGFPEAIVRVFGSNQTAQMVRAGGRAARVVAWLVENGVPGDQIRRLPPPPQPTYRGVELAIVPACLPSPSVGAGVVYASGLAGRHGRMGHPALAPAPGTAVQQAAPPPEAPPWGRAWIGAAAIVDGMQVEPQDLFDGSVRLDLGWSNELAYAHLAGGPVYGSWIGQRRGFEAVAGAGWVPVEWLQIGAVYGYRLAAAKFFSPWLERTWFVGAEAAQCTAPFGGDLRVCLLAAIAPWGERVRRAAEVDGLLYYIPERTDSIVRFSLGIAVRQLL